jgi:uncharacterized protein (DUF427 family)
MMKELPEGVKAAQAKWQYRGLRRPSFAIDPQAGQESVWDYPRPPRIVRDHRHVIVRANGRIIADSQSTYRVLETASPPTFYIPPDEIENNALVQRAKSSLCEWKGTAQYWCLNIDGFLLEDVAWSYPSPFPRFESIAGYVAFYPNRVACYVNEELVQPQPGGLYGGWVTQEIVGPFKGEPGTESW